MIALLGQMIYDRAQNCEDLYPCITLKEEDIKTETIPRARDNKAGEEYNNQDTKTVVKTGIQTKDKPGSDLPAPSGPTITRNTSPLLPTARYVLFLPIP